MCNSIPSLRPPTLSRVVCCLWSTVLYSERPSYRHLCVSPLRLCGSAESDLVISLGEGGSDCPVTTILFGVGRLAFLSLSHIYYTTQRGKSQVVILHKLFTLFDSFFVQVAGSAPGRPPRPLIWRVCGEFCRNKFLRVRILPEFLCHQW